MSNPGSLIHLQKERVKKKTKLFSYAVSQICPEMNILMTKCIFNDLTEYLFSEVSEQR